MLNSRFCILLDTLPKVHVSYWRIARTNLTLFILVILYSWEKLVDLIWLWRVDKSLKRILQVCFLTVSRTRFYLFLMMLLFSLLMVLVLLVVRISERVTCAMLVLKRRRTMLYNPCLVMISLRLLPMNYLSLLNTSSTMLVWTKLVTLTWKMLLLLTTRLSVLHKSSNLLMKARDLFSIAETLLLMVTWKTLLILVWTLPLPSGLVLWLILNLPFYFWPILEWKKKLPRDWWELDLTILLVTSMVVSKLLKMLVTKRLTPVRFWPLKNFVSLQTTLKTLSLISEIRAKLIKESATMQRLFLLVNWEIELMNCPRIKKFTSIVRVVLDPKWLSLY